jgi:hypothetical protein
MKKNNQTRIGLKSILVVMMIFSGLSVPTQGFSFKPSALAGLDCLAFNELCDGSPAVHACTNLLNSAIATCARPCAGNTACANEQALDSLEWQQTCEEQRGTYSDVVVGDVVTSQTCTN